MPMKTIEGYSKEKYTNTSVLLAGGGAKALSDFIGSLSWDSTNKKIKYTPVGGSTTDLVTLSWDNIANKPTSLPANGGNADTSNRTKFLETFQQNSTTTTYGAQYPIWAQWSDSANVRLKCTNYTVWTDKADNADTVDGQNFSYSNDSNSPTYLWGTNSNGSSFLAARGSISVNYANSAGSATSATQATNLTPENTAHYFRDPNNSSWRGGMIWGSAESESMSFVVANSGTRFQFVGGSDIANWESSTWKSVNPYLTIYSSGIVTPGSATASGGFIKSGYDNTYALLAGGGHKLISDFATAGHTHSYLPLSGGTLTGTLGKSNNYIFKPNGGDFRTKNNTYTGAICISLPTNIGNTMLSMWIDVYNYSTNKSFSVHVGGYTYSTGNFSNNPFAMVYGASHKVRLTYDNGFKIYIGETNSTWNYPQISIRDVVLGFDPNYSNWYNDWSVSFVTSFPTINKEITRYAITTDNIKDQNVNFASSATNAGNVKLLDSDANSDYRLSFGTYNSSYASLYSSQYLTYNPYSGRLKLKGSKEYNSVVKGGSISFGDGDFLYMKEAKDDVLLQHYKGLVSDTQPIAIGFVGSCPSNSSASLVYKKSQPSAITANCTRSSSGRFVVSISNNSGKPIIAHLQVTPVRNYAQYEFAFAYIEDFTMDTADGGKEIASGSTGYFYVRTGRIHCQGTWAAGDYVATGDTGGFTGVVYAMINESLATMPSTSW